jgi:hypothetical protein
MAARRNRIADLVTVAALLAAGVVIAWPVLTDGYLTYLDNPSHLAEAISLAGEARAGWSDIAWCGFPIGVLHSPLWYGLLAWLIRAGVDAARAYPLLAFIGFVSPALSVYAVARRRLPATGAGALAFLLLVQRPAVVGVGSALGGMWTFYIAAAAIALLIDRLARPCRTPRDVAWVAGLSGLVGLTHLFAAVPIVVLVVVDLARSALARRESGAGRGRDEPPGRQAAMRLAAWALGAGLAGRYWLPALIARGETVVHAQNLSFPAALARLAVPTDVLALLNGRFEAVDARFLLDAAPMLVLVALGFVGVALIRKREDDVPLLGAWLALTVFVLVAVVVPLTGTAFLGPVSWRMIYFVRLGLALAAVPALAGFRPGRVRVPGAAVASVLVVAAFLGASVWGAPLRRAVPPRASGSEMAEVESLWKWLAASARSDGGRVYVQDTFATPPRDAALARSHVLAMTSERTGVRQLGATYSVAPYRTAEWTRGEGGRLYNLRLDDPREVRELLLLMRYSNAGRLVTSDPTAAERIATVEVFNELHRAGRFAVFELEGNASSWVEPLSEGLTAEGDPGTGADGAPDASRFAVRYRSERDGGALLVKSSYHRFWRYVGPGADAQGGVALRAHDSGLTIVDGLPAGEHEFELVYRQPAWPLWITLAALAAVVAIAVRSRRRGEGPRSASPA